MNPNRSRQQIPGGCSSIRYAEVMMRSPPLYMMQTRQKDEISKVMYQDISRVDRRDLNSLLTGDAGSISGIWCLITIQCFTLLSGLSKNKQLPK